MSRQKPKLDQLAQSGATSSQVPTWNGAEWVPATPAALGITVQDENVNVGTGVTQIDFQGAGITATPGTGEVIVTVPAIPTTAGALTTAIVPLTTVVAGTPDLVWDASDNLVLIEVAYP